MRPDWIVPERLPTGVGALMTTRAGGVSSGPFATMNLGLAVGDEPAAVAENRSRLAAVAAVRPIYLHQVHAARVVRVGAADAAREPPTADACVTVEAGIGCAVQVADCLPVLLAAPAGRAVAAAHAGWRGLAGGVVEAALAALCAAAGCAPQAVWVWLGPCIGPRRFEVGPDVVRAFEGARLERFVAAPSTAQGPRWIADLAGLAHDRLRAAGVVNISGGAWCTVEDVSRFFSFRRDRVTGRMVAMVWIR